ncbi:hypothetical protein JHK82_039809 [Glycine max]|uniref:RRM domain-containing protein n=2 Tax=Glycine subgen. Soja TaxID=1462606 RepID=A0A0R0GCY3_SOYBN|nr:hypothetical protein JHK86_040007 [Glycine max]RZB68873.1 hypothetical protein D0Y65_038587 [Glycine soja]KAG4965606.1 hypothetical protein JHK85_040581 [Glycine max]KAG5110586.1 hypothetical protein JHK82_039809 [Glycine max]KAG5121876.1 hypothetical protein JHK84_040216 [Glycine max]
MKLILSLNRNVLGHYTSPPSLALSSKTKAQSRLSFNTTQQHLKKLFFPCILVTQANLVLGPITKRLKGFGFVSFKYEIKAEKAFKAMNENNINQDPIADYEYD